VSRAPGGPTCAKSAAQRRRGPTSFGARTKAALIAPLFLTRARLPFQTPPLEHIITTRSPNAKRALLRLSRAHPTSALPHRYLVSKRGERGEGRRETGEGGDQKRSRGGRSERKGSTDEASGLPRGAPCQGEGGAAAACASGDDAKRERRQAARTTPSADDGSATLHLSYG
jgi:hypothetical protein